MKYIACIGFVAIVFCTGMYQGHLYSYAVKENIPHIRQPKSMDCWITVLTMMISWRDHKVYSLQEAADIIGPPYSDYYRHDLGLPLGMEKELTHRAGLKSEPPAEYTIEAYAEFLQKYGPIWISTGNGISSHARLLTEVWGNGDYNTSKFIFIDPATGRNDTLAAIPFYKQYDAEAYVANEDKWSELRIQIFHF
jgi:hypothetical protein